ncbi:MAG: TonB-dependent receptor plug domain-containing protein [Vitreoscilla sp.]
MPICSSRCSRNRRPAAPWAMLGLLGAVAPAWAQGQPMDDAPGSQHVVVTGSQLSAIDMESALPVQVITRQDIERSGVTSVEELVARLGVNVGNVSHAVNIGNEDNPGFTGVSLRGLGERSTLVLLNGRRLSNYAFSKETGVGVDLGQIPVAAIERVEILTDGASAIYGSDAIAGVVNFIMRSEFKGVEASMQAERPQAHGGGGTDHQTASFGLGSNAVDGFNLFATLDHQREHALAARDRAFAADFRPGLRVDGTTAASLPANVPLGGGLFANPAAPGCTPATVFVHGGCFYDVGRYNDLLPETENLGGLLRATLSFARHGQAYAEVLASRQRVRESIAPTAVNFQYYSSRPDWVIPVGSPFYRALPGVDGDIVDPSYRAISLGPRVRRNDTQAWRALVGWRGEAAGWELDGALMQSTTHSASVLVSGFVDADKLQGVLAAGIIDPFADSGPTGDAALASTLIHGSTREARGTTQGIDFHASRDLGAWRGGIATFGFGGEARHESMRDSPTALSPLTVGSHYQAYKSGQRDVQALYFEAIVPVAPQMQAQLAARVDRYSDFGTHLSPKLSLRWQPVPALLLRGAMGTGFRAPSLPEMFTAQTNVTDEAEVDDPERCPVTGLAADCPPVVNLRAGGNPALRPETSRDLTLGMVIAASPDSALQLNAWRIVQKNLIGELGDDALLVSTGRYDGTWVVRGPVDPAYPKLPGPVLELIETNENLGNATTMGIDVDLRSAIRTSSGKWSGHMAGTFQAKARWQHTLALGWERGAWHATVDEVWKAGYRDGQPGLDGRQRRVAPYNVWGTQLGYGGQASPWQFAVGAKNLFNTDPPFTNQKTLPQRGYNSAIADPRGRVWYVQATCRWH